MAIVNTSVGPTNGRLFIEGGNDVHVFAEFVRLVGDSDAPVVVIPTAAEGHPVTPRESRIDFFQKAGLTNLTLLHTRDRREADSESFVRPLREARAVYFIGGRQWRLADAYLHTAVHRELAALLARGGVIGGSSAGASIQASFLARGDTRTSDIMIGDHLEGFGFLKNTVIDQHLLKRNRQFDLIEVIRLHPELLGIGIDEHTAILVEGDTFEVVGRGHVAIYDYNRLIPPNGKFYFLSPGDRFDMSTRMATHADSKPLERVIAAPWD